MINEDKFVELEKTVIHSNIKDKLEIGRAHV